MPFCDAHTHHLDNRPEVIQIVSQEPSRFNREVPWFSIGLHPWHLNADSIQQELERLELLSQSQRCLAIGECGLDKKTGVSFELQTRAFLSQIQLAEKLQKPLIVHCVSAYQEVISMCRGVAVPVIIHGFAKNHQVADSLIRAGFYLSFGHRLGESEALGKTFAQLPSERLLLETDAAPVSIEQVFGYAAKWVGPETLDQIRTNFSELFPKTVGA